MGLIMGTLFLQMDDDQAGSTQRSAVIFFSLLICDLLAMRTVFLALAWIIASITYSHHASASIPKILGERPVFYREYAARTYNSLVYAATVILPEIPFALCTAVLYTIPLYFISGLQYDAGKYFIFIAIFLLSNLLAISLCHVIGLLSPNLVVANSLSGTLTRCIRPCGEPDPICFRR